MIELSEDEAALWATIEAFWGDRARNPHNLDGDRWRAEAIGEKQRALADSLLARGAVPRARVRYFADPACNIGSSRSRRDEMVING